MSKYSDMTHQLQRLQAENARLIALLEQHGIAWQLPLSGSTSAQPSLTTEQKVKLFKRLFRGRDDVFPLRWYSQKSGRSGYAPACSNEWKPGVCQKPRVKCADCAHRVLMPISDDVVYNHLAGLHVMGVYPLLSDNRCYFLAVDFDEACWREDCLAFVASCDELGVAASLEISRSGNGAHVWIFFERALDARDARRLGCALISATCDRTRQLELRSYDRLFPNQDVMPKGGFGNLIALPLQKRAREQGGSVFVDRQLQPYTDQWAYLSSVQCVKVEDIEAVIVRATGKAHPLDVSFIEQQDYARPWQRPEPINIQGELPECVTITLANKLYIAKDGLPQSLLNRLIRLAAFQNPGFYKAQAMRMSVWDKPRIICSAENYPQHIALPRGCLDAVQALLQELGIHLEFEDERCYGSVVNLKFAGNLRPDQQVAVTAMLQYQSGVLSAPTAFGKTVSAAALIAQCKVNTLVLVHRKELLKQWLQRLETFLQVDADSIGFLGGGKAKLSGRLDVAVMQSLISKGEVNPLVESYGLVIVDECHHIGAISFDEILKQVKAHYVFGLTATPVRRDGLQPLIFMQCGPIRHTARQPEGAPHQLEVEPMFYRHPAVFPDEIKIQELFLQLVNDAARTAKLVAAIVDAWQQGRKILVLTERMQHLLQIQQSLTDRVDHLFVLHGRLSAGKRESVLSQLAALDGKSPRVLLATGKLVGEGFDHPPLDTLLLAMPISWKGTLQQYAGRLHREHADKQTVKIIDLVDSGHPMLQKMWEKRQRGYKAMGYSLLT